MRRPRWTSPFVALVLASASLVGTGAVLPISRAGASSIAGRRAEAAKLAAQIEGDNRRVDTLTARFEAAQLAAATVDGRVTSSAAALEAASARISRTQGAVRD